MFKTIFIGCLVLFAASCNSESKKQQDLTLLLHDPFESIYLTRFGLEFPHTDKQLETCIKAESQGCIRVYNRVKEAKKTLLALPSNEALEATLDVIESACQSKDLDSTYNICYGGIMTLYFYDSVEHDEIMFKRIQKYSNDIEKLIFSYGFYWFHNRPNPDLWVDYVASLDIEWEPEERKVFILNRFKTPIQNLEDKDPWVLRDMH